MEVQAYKLDFQTVHFGNGSLNESIGSFNASRLYSSLFLESLKLNVDKEFLNLSKSANFFLSDSFPLKDGEFYLKTGTCADFHIDLLLDWIEENAFDLNIDPDEVELLLQKRNQMATFRTILDHSYMIGRVFYDIERDETGIFMESPEVRTEAQERTYRQLKEQYLDKNGVQWLETGACRIPGSPEYPLTENSFKHNKMM